MRGLYEANSPARFWRPLVDPGAGAWERAQRAAAVHLPEAVRHGLAAGQDLAELVLGEGQFGPDHWRLGPAKRLYYGMKPALPRFVVGGLRRVQGRLVRASPGALRWPVEDRWVRFQAALLGHVMREMGAGSLPLIDFWPGGERFALVLTHDVETAAGQRFAGRVADLEESMGFRSGFNLVAGLYPLDRALVAGLVARGFEVGVHGYRHDGRLFSSRAEFSRRAALINRQARELGARGFRSPLTLRNPAWMQELDIEYDLSFFDTDPFEPTPGGSMSIWPFQVGAFTELPYTLAQDHTLRVVLGERTPRLWREKLAFIARSRGMALLNTHPDYLRERQTFDMYREFLSELRAGGGFWHALPGEVARWWRARAAAASPAELPGAAVRFADSEAPFADAGAPPHRAA